MISACADSVTGSKVPACHFAHSLASLPARSAFRLRRQPLVCPSFRLHPRLKPVAFFTGLLCRLRRLPPLPFRSFRSLRIKASTGFATVRSAFRNCPISVRSPQPFHLKIRLRIIVPDPLHFRGFAQRVSSPDFRKPPSSGRQLSAFTDKCARSFPVAQRSGVLLPTRVRQSHPVAFPVVLSCTSCSTDLVVTMTPQVVRSAPEFMSLTGHDTGQRSW